MIRPSTRQLLREDLVRHGARITHPGALALFTYRFGTWRNALRPGPVRKLLRVPYLAMHRRVRNRHRIELHYTASLGRRVRLSGRGDIVIGNHVVLGDDCWVGQGVTLGKTRDDATGWPVIGNRVVIGPGAVVAGDIHLGDDAVVGPNSVVLADLSAGAKVSARPAIAEKVPGGGHPGPETTRPYSMRFSWFPFGDELHRLLLRRRRITLERTARFGSGLRLHRDGNLTLGAQVNLGQDCIVGYGVTVGWRDDQSTGPSPMTRLGDRVVLAAGSVVLAGVTIGDDARIGINALVADDVPAGSAVASPPAGVLRAFHSPSP